MKLTETDIHEIIEASRSALAKTKVTEDEVEEFLSTATGILNDYRNALGEDAEITYRVFKRLGRI